MGVDCSTPCFYLSLGKGLTMFREPRVRKTFKIVRFRMHGCDVCLNFNFYTTGTVELDTIHFVGDEMLTVVTKMHHENAVDKIKLLIDAGCQPLFYNHRTVD